MEGLVIGVPARDEGETIAGLADALELGGARLGEAIRCELVLAYQSGTDDTLAQWGSRRFRMANRVLYCPEGVSGKGRNVKLLIRHAQQRGAHLLLVDADLRSYPPSNVGRFVQPNELAHAGLILPLWSRPRGQGNSTDFLACPLLFATFGARVRQPLAGQMLLSQRFLASVNVDDLPDDYGIDVALTMHALDRDLPVTQVVTPFPDHQGGGNSHRIMANVAATMLDRLSRHPPSRRRDVVWPQRFWEGLSVPSPATRNLDSLIEQVAPPGPSGRWRDLMDRPPEVLRDMWCDHLAAAVRNTRAGEPVAEEVAHLAYPFLVHAEYRRRLAVDRVGAESYVMDLGERLALAIA
ncbi:MAG: hypothetical protein J2P57_01990 [Acidimicrobiaceae bacterium]|nr:hypothetical protein [Acidimicrobiaceae bacterium]